jgi:hypothetical protein
MELTNEENELLNPQGGRADISIREYNSMRDTLLQLLKTTRTHKEFIKDFRTSLIQIVSLAKEQGVDLSPMYDYYENLDMKKIESMEFISIPEDDSKENSIKFVLTLKIAEDEKTGLSSINY